MVMGRWDPKASTATAYARDRRWRFGSRFMVADQERISVQASDSQLTSRGIVE
jgi:hypothetical protein